MAAQAPAQAAQAGEKPKAEAAAAEKAGPTQHFRIQFRDFVSIAFPLPLSGQLC